VGLRVEGGNAATPTQEALMLTSSIISAIRSTTLAITDNFGGVVAGPLASIIQAIEDDDLAGLAEPVQQALVRLAVRTAEPKGELALALAAENNGKAVAFGTSGYLFRPDWDEKVADELSAALSFVKARLTASETAAMGSRLDAAIAAADAA